jgi:hypothetical protein
MPGFFDPMFLKQLVILLVKFPGRIVRSIQQIFAESIIAGYERGTQEQFDQFHAHPPLANGSWF